MEKGLEAWEQGAQEEAGWGEGTKPTEQGWMWMGRQVPPSISPNPLNLKTGFWAGPCSALFLEIG